MSIRGLPPAEVFQRAIEGDRRAVGRLLTIVERGGPAADEVGRLTHRAAGGAHIVGVTGAPGAGKSTLTGQLAATANASDAEVAVLAIDPSSPLTGGAILGDRIRMDDVTRPEGTFIRSMATRGASGGLAVAVPGAVRVLDAAGFDPVIVETVGVGQVEVEIAGAADTTVVVVTPGWGDAVQANKAGLLEVADIFVVNKADRPGASDARRDLELMLDLTAHTHHPGEGDWRPPIIMTTATEGDGSDELWKQLGAHRQWLDESGDLEVRRSTRARHEVEARAERELTTTLRDRMAGATSESILARVESRELAPAEAAAKIVADVLDP